MAPRLIPLTAKSTTAVYSPISATVRCGDGPPPHREAPEQFFLVLLAMRHCGGCSLTYETQDRFAQRDSARGVNNPVDGEGREGISGFQPCHICH